MKEHCIKEYDIWVNERQMQTTEDKVDLSKALDASLVDTESSGTALKEQDTSSKLGNDAHADGLNDLDFQATVFLHVMSLRLVKNQSLNYLPKDSESAVVAKPHHMIAPGSSRYSSNDMVHKHYLEEAKKKTQESSRNSEPSVMPSARSQSTTNGSKPKPRINNQKSRNWPASKSSCVTTKTVPIAEHSRNSRSFSDSKHFVCSTCQKCVFNANHDSCVTKFLNEVNLRAKVPSHKTTTRYNLVEQTSVAKKPKRQIPIGHRFSIKKTSVVHEKTITPRSCLRWKPTGKIFKTVGLKWIPTGKIFTSSTTKVDSEPTNGSNDDITNQYECEQTLDVSAGTLNLSAGTSFNPKKEGLRVCSELRIHDHSNELSSSKLVPKVVPPADKTATSRQELELLFHHHITMLSIFMTNFNNKVQMMVLQPHSSRFRFITTCSMPQILKIILKASRFKNQESSSIKDKDFRKLDKQDLPLRYQVYQGRLLASFQDDAKYEHVGQDTRSQGGKADPD
ncbi:hypothetical protein Tco_0289612 [Tanacetum coccineum]